MLLIQVFESRSTTAYVVMDEYGVTKTLYSKSELLKYAHLISNYTIECIGALNMLRITRKGAWDYKLSQIKRHIPDRVESLYNTPKNMIDDEVTRWLKSINGQQHLAYCGMFMKAGFAS